MMKKTLTLILLLLVTACATTTNNSTVTGPLSSILMSQRDLDTYFNDFRNENNPIFSGKAINIISDYLKADMYNTRITAKIQSHEDYEKYQELHAQFAQSQLARELHSMRVATIDLEQLNSYIKNYSQEPDAHQRFLLTEEIVKVSFPDMHQVDLLAKLAVKLLTDSEELQKRAAYRTIYDLLRGRITHLNLYLFKNIPLETLQDAVDYSNQEHIKGSNQFISDIQKEVHDAIFEELNQLFISAGLPRTDPSVFN